MSRHDKSVRVPTQFVLLTAAAYTAGGDILTPPDTRALLVGTAGVQDITMMNNTTADLLPLQVGINLGEFKALRSDAGNTAANIWAVV